MVSWIQFYFHKTYVVTFWNIQLNRHPVPCTLGGTTNTEMTQCVSKRHSLWCCWQWAFIITTTLYTMSSYEIKVIFLKGWCEMTFHGWIVLLKCDIKQSSNSHRDHEKQKNYFPHETNWFGSRSQISSGLKSIQRVGG